ncbi:hypothetical protein KUTeg_015496 [Tegillarca granosa]|uniref:Sema domain-containing protein n=1 Tax=Tegillarca granosa TaxID=220873 RepID=A0ABQ9ETX4_TEGGR|nr:hypothetical protein KUTeg_015496 [Tegillarca granosa]
MCKTKRFIMSIFLCVILMMFFDSSTTTLTTTEFPKEFDFRYTSYQELEQNFNIFQHDDIVGYDVQLTVDNARNQLLVGGRGMLCRLSLDDLRILEITEWQALNDTKRICRFKGQTEDACYNFIRVLLVYEDQVFTCGTNAFSPKCTWRSIRIIHVIIISIIIIIIIIVLVIIIIVKIELIIKYINKFLKILKN